VSSEIVAGAIGAAFGAVFTVGGTWWVSTLLDRQRENRRLIGAIGVVSAEVEENRIRIERLRAEGVSAHAAGKRLTLGDWSSNKPALAGLLVRNEPLWDEVVGVYGVIYEARSSPGEPADVDRLAELKRRLDDLEGPLATEHLALRRDLRVFSTPFGRAGERNR
jgi:hypothetical protein